jgi:hypothetical protein
LNINHRFNEKWSVNVSWVYQSGIPYTPVISRQLVPVISPDGTISYHEALIYGERNSSRMKDYHRLDLGINLNTKTKNGRKATWTFSVYNAYNRKNPVTYYYGNNIEGRMNKNYFTEGYKPISMYQISYFTIIPGISYKIYFE